MGRELERGLGREREQVLEREQVREQVLELELELEQVSHRQH